MRKGVKEFTFYNIIEKTKKNKNKIVALLNSDNSKVSTYKYDLTLSTIYECIFRIKEKVDKDIIHVIFLQPTFCGKCGNYIENQTTVYNNPNYSCDGDCF
jgi:hypothetical protein